MLYPEMAVGNRADRYEAVSPTTLFIFETTCSEQENPTG